MSRQPSITQTTRAYSEIAELLVALGYRLQFVKFKEHKVRWSCEENFVDTWESRRGITIGVYDPDTGEVTYHRNVTIDTLEDCLQDNHLRQ